MRASIYRAVFWVGVLWAGGFAGAQEVKPMAASADPAFEVAAIKLSDPANGSSGFQTRGHRVIVLNETVESMMVFAYGVQPRQIAGAPGWVSTDHYDVSGFPDADGVPDVKQFRSMVRKVLGERFHLQMHEEQREMPVYALRVAKGGAKLAKAANPVENQPDQTGNDGAVSDYRFTNNSMTEFASFLQFEMDRPVLDETGLAGRYDFELKWTRDTARQVETDTGPGMFTAVQEQLGLRMEATREPAKVLVIDRLERPSAN